MRPLDDQAAGEGSGAGRRVDRSRDLYRQGQWQGVRVEVAEGGEIDRVQEQGSSPAPSEPAASSGEAITAPLAGNIFKVNVKPGDSVAEGDVVIILEAMKMETEVRAASAGTVSEVKVSEGDSVAVGDELIVL